MLSATLVAALAIGQGGAPKTDILGVRVGMPLVEARAILDKLGEGGGRDTRGNGRKEAWALRDGPFLSVALKTDGKQCVSWVSGFARPGREIAFVELGDPAKADLRSLNEIVWNVPGPEGGTRLVAKGGGGKATVVYLLSLKPRESDL